MSKNLIAAGFTAIGFDISSRAVDAFKALGGTAAASVAEVGKAANILITSLPSSTLFDVVGELQKLPRGIVWWRKLVPSRWSTSSRRK
jgi:3-hydroxyisobutyrate dehydrogenase-like beta-hydroxyacid dehydrogenase